MGGLALWCHAIVGKFRFLLYLSAIGKSSYHGLMIDYEFSVSRLSLYSLKISKDDLMKSRWLMKGLEVQ